MRHIRIRGVSIFIIILRFLFFVCFDFTRFKIAKNDKYAFLCSTMSEANSFLCC